MILVWILLYSLGALFLLLMRILHSTHRITPPPAAKSQVLPRIQSNIMPELDGMMHTLWPASDTVPLGQIVGSVVPCGQ